MNLSRIPAVPLNKPSAVFIAELLYLCVLWVGASAWPPLQSYQCASTGWDKMISCAKCKRAPGTFSFFFFSHFHDVTAQCMQTQQNEITAGPQNSRDGQMTADGVSGRRCVFWSAAIWNVTPAYLNAARAAVQYLWNAWKRSPGV